MAAWLKKVLRYRLLALGCLTLLATATLKYSSLWDCDYTDLGVDTRHLGNEYCKDRLYQALKLPAQNRINCTQIIKGDRSALEEASLRSLEAKRVPLTETQYLHMTKDCSFFKNERRFIQFPLSKEEENFPIAYSMVIHEKIENFERLLRAVYAPQNVYCVHVDEKSPEPYKEAVRAIASCFPNVFVATKLVAVVYASWSRVQADLNCMEDLLRSPVPWKYLLNTCGTDFPIKTNAEMVRSLKVLNGKNSMESEVPSAYKRGRWKHRYTVEKDRLLQTKTEKGPPPDNVPVFTGNAYFVARRSFVQHLFKNPNARKLIEWTNDTYSPDEHLWATLQRVPWMPGSIPHHSKYHTSDLGAIARLVKWMGHEGDVVKGAPYAPCTGTHQRAVCIYGAGDLHWMLQNHHLLANKFDPRVDDNALQCLEEYLRYKAVYGRAL
ncbi:beta-1,3-galactosyl-O-glycosyl-glycoprotein beta-1,6-N-acetylglucosaminyltransferase 3 [Tachyglossus aculeatus]|uniref:beta-1,3-galactosyl-O-glycosyl-glycoprotein beta-1,6-N-acetylglucosaminyltransferase 3 n=1 Tax=Tachyglossus aculeatus TaxID=9261 RepID=UPI0018F79100|nr:beta-1,3-galactosyl-O-glycosyl-glycoprotein beta-1,6-N-acetylglucosaminyltransferase 3 [Tachyglossus aculeatus]